MSFNDNEAIVIPAFKPARSMLDLIKGLKANNARNIVVINDGSGVEYDDVFSEAEALGCVLIVQAVNQGKGRALKTAFNYILSTMPHISGAVMADADGQHTPQDIMNCIATLRDNETALVLGCRNFDQNDVPARSLLGNKLTRSAMKTLCGVRVSDTQTGLRALGREFMARMITVEGERYEYETNMLLETKRAEIPIKEVPISTVYINDNESSHFNPIKDSIKIYALLFKFVAASFASSIVDILMFTIFISILKRFDISSYIIIATIAARIISAVFNYLVNRNIVFASKKHFAASGIKYLVLCIVQMTVSALAVSLLYAAFPFSEVALKIIVDLILFLISFQIQNRFIF